MKIVVIDTGIKQSFAQYVDEFYYIEGQEVYKWNKDTENDHGGICAAIIKKYFTESEIVSMQILDENGKTDIDRLLLALEWCLKQEINIISLSLGSVFSEDKQKMENVIHKLLKKDIVLVAAANNTNTVTYPASMEGVIGVKCDLSDTLVAQQIFVDTEDIRNIEVTVGSLKDCDGLKQYNLGYHNSFVVPYVTAQIAKKFKKGNVPLAALDSNVKCVPKEFYMNSFPFLYKTESIVVKLSGKDYEENQLLEIVKMFRKEGYEAIGLLSHSSDYRYCYNCEEKNGLSSKENYDFISKALNPDIIFSSGLNFEMTKDIEIIVDDSKETFLEKDQQCDSVKADRDRYENSSYLGSIGNYGITITGDVKTITNENVFFDEDISEEERELIISRVKEHIGIMEEDDQGKIFISTEDIYTEKIIETLEEIFS